MSTLETPQDDEEEECLNKNVISKKVTSHDVEIWEVAQLNSNIEQCSKPSDLFDKLEEGRKVRHEKVLRNLARSLQEVNEKTEKNVTISSLEVKAHIKYYEEKLKGILSSIDSPEVVTYTVPVFMNFQKTANEYKLKQEKIINELYEDLNRFENERAEENEKLLHVACENMRKIAYLLPFDLQRFVEHETMKMNKLSLNNRRCYEDLKLTLTLITEQMYKSFMDKIYCTQEKWVHSKIRKAFSTMQCKAEEVVSKVIPDAYLRLELKGQELILNLSPDELYSSCKIEEWSKNVQEVVDAIESHGQNVIELYRKILDAVFCSFDNQVEEIRKEISALETLEIEERVIKPILFEAQNEYICEVDDLERFWQYTLNQIRNVLKDVTEFLMDAGKLWDRHSERVCESKKLILQALQKSYANNQSVRQEFEVKLNIVLDALRQEHNKAKVEKLYEDVVSILNSLKSKYESMYLSDVDIVEDFYKMMRLEADVLSADLQEFIYVTHPTEQDVNGSNLCDHAINLAEVKDVCTKIQTCACQIQAVRNWKFGVWTAMENFSHRTKEMLELRAEYWVDIKVSSLAEEMSIQLELLEKRYKRVEVEIYGKRLKEIECHQRNYILHKENVQRSYKRLKENLANVTEKELKNLKFIEEKYTEAKTNALKEDRAGVIKSVQILLEKKKEEIVSFVKSAYGRFRAESQIKTMDLKRANIDFMKSIKLFHEDGNFSAEEGKTYATQLESLDNEITSESKNLEKEATKAENDIIAKYAAALTPITTSLSLLFEETLFNQEIQFEIQSFKEKINEIAVALNTDMELLKLQTECICEILSHEETCMKGDNYSFFLIYLETLYKNISNLFYPMKFAIPQESSTASVEEGEQYEEELSPCGGFANFPIKIPISKTSTFGQTSQNMERDSRIKDFKFNLFGTEEPPENDGTFMAIIGNSLWTELDFLQRVAHKFYKKIQGRKIIREDLVPPNYDTVIGEILLKFKYYNMQCEQLWFQTILDFLPLVGRIKIALNKFLNQKLDFYERMALTSLRHFEEDFKSCLEHHTAKAKEEFEALDKKLLPLHGHPQNKHLLNKLHEEVTYRTAALGVKWETSIEEFKYQLCVFRNSHIKNQAEINDILSDCFRMRDKIFVEGLGRNFENTLLEHVRRKGYYNRKSFQDTSHTSQPKLGSIKSSPMELPEESQLKLNAGLQTVEVYVKQLRSILEVERFNPSESFIRKCYPISEKSEKFLPESAERDPCFLCQPKLGFLLEPAEYKPDVELILQELDKNLKRMKEYADSKVNCHDEALFKWLNNWKFNVVKVKELYGISNEEKLEATEKPETELNA